MDHLLPGGFPSLISRVTILMNAIDIRSQPGSACEILRFFFCWVEFHKI